MKLLIIIHSLSSGGAERVTANLANYWAAKGWNVSIVTMTGSKSDFYTLHPKIQRMTLGLDAESQSPWQALESNTRRIKAIRQQLKQQQPDIALAMMTTANILLALAAKGLAIPLVGSEHIHPPMLPLGRVWEGLRRVCYRYLVAVSALTEDSATWIKQCTSANYVPIIPNAATYPIEIQAPILDPRKNLGKKYNLIAVGRLAPQKGFDRLLQAFAELSPRFPDWHLTILGEGAERDDLEKQCVALNLTVQTSLPGVAGNLADWYQSADLYVMTSRYEGFGNTLVEAMAYGLPVVSVDCDTGPRNIIRHEVDGLLIPQDNHAALVKVLAMMMSDPTLREQYASRAIEIRQRLSMEKVASMWECVFDGAINQVKNK